jgi:transcriptional regulator with XRE-family HTH domain
MYNESEKKNRYLNMKDETQNLGSIVRQQRNRLGLTLADLSAKSGVSTSHLGRIENAQRYPSTRVLRQIAKPLNLDEKELFDMAGYLPTDELKTHNLEKHKLLTELDILINRATADLNRIKSVIRELHKKS